MALGLWNPLRKRLGLGMKVDFYGSEDCGMEVLGRESQSQLFEHHNLQGNEFYQYHRGCIEPRLYDTGHHNGSVGRAQGGGAKPIASIVQ